MNPSDVDQQLTGLAGLGDPIRRALYRHVADRGVPVSRDEAAHTAGISRPLAAYHLDKLVDDGPSRRYHRRGGAAGPGAGPPGTSTTSVPTSDSSSACRPRLRRLAELLAHAVEADHSGTAQAALNRAAATLGAELGTEAASHSAPDGHPDQVLAAVRQALAARGYEPYDDPDGTIRLRNCPFDRIAAQHRQLVCGANHAMLQALTDQVDSDPPTVRAVLDPQPGAAASP
jgi:predicted ArsR family transcriptional regulator